MSTEKTDTPLTEDDIRSYVTEITKERYRLDKNLMKLTFLFGKDGPQTPTFKHGPWRSERSTQPYKK